MTVANAVFTEDGKLKVMTKDEWRDDYVKWEVNEMPSEEESDLPF